MWKMRFRNFLSIMALIKISIGFYTLYNVYYCNEYQKKATTVSRSKIDAVFSV